MKLEIDMSKPLGDMFPKEWNEELNKDKLQCVPFRNLQHFKAYAAKVRQRQDTYCGVSYSEALDDLKREKSQYSKAEYESIRDLVRSTLLKRGLITEDIYESYKYASEGVIVDISKVINEDPECFLTPVKSYTNHFYELYVSISYNSEVSDETVRENAIKLLSTIEELERQHIYIKVTLVFGDHCPNRQNDLLVTIPLFSHKDFKSIETMSAVLNERLLRKFMFALLEDVYGSDLDSGYGQAVTMTSTINIGDQLDEVKLFTSILDQVVTGGKR